MLTLPLVVHITLRIENTYGGTCVVKCTGYSASPKEPHGPGRASRALSLSLRRALSLIVVLEALRVYV